jgi:hypothetical protein
MTDLYTIEHIHTFTCPHCKNWWTYPTMHDDLPYYLKEGRWTCPHCAMPASERPA